MVSLLGCGYSYWFALLFYVCFALLVDLVWNCWFCDLSCFVWFTAVLVLFVVLSVWLRFAEVGLWIVFCV